MDTDETRIAGALADGPAWNEFFIGSQILYPPFLPALKVGMADAR
jgi:hypothetical protein